MFCFRWLFRRKKQAISFGPWEKAATAKMPQPAQESRHYLDAVAYQLPKDAEEDVRLNFQHHVLFHALGNHYVAPISPPLPLILDVGTGTGIWANEMARLFPEATVVGIDLADTSFKQPAQENCLLRTGNVVTGLPFPDAFFAFTHQRLLVAGIMAHQWPGVIHELVRVTRRQGWIELVEVPSLAEGAGPATACMQTILETVSRNRGFDGEVIRHLGEMLAQEGVQSIEQQRIPIPIGNWAGRVGSMMKRDLLAVVAALRNRYCPQAGITEAEFDQIVQEMAQEWEVYRPSCTFYAIYGKRGEA